MVHAALDRWLSSDMAGEMDGRFALPMAGQAGGLGPHKQAVLARLDRPMPMADALTSRLEAAALDRLVARGLVMISGVTPSDASHVLGQLESWDAAAAEKALQLMARRRTGAGERFAQGPLALAQAIVDQLTAQTVECLLEAAFAEDTAFAGEDPVALALHRLTAAGLSRHSGIVALSARLAVPVIRAESSAPCSAVGERLGCEMILPEHAGVANHRRGGGAGQPAGDGDGILARRGAVHGAYVHRPAAFCRPGRGDGCDGGHAARRGGGARPGGGCGGPAGDRQPRGARRRDRGPDDVHRGHGDRHRLGPPRVAHERAAAAE